MKRLKRVEVFQARDARYLRLWQYAGRGGQALVKQVRLKDGETPASVLASSEIRALLRDEFGHLTD